MTDRRTERIAHGARILAALFGLVGSMPAISAELASTWVTTLSVSDGFMIEPLPAPPVVSEAGMIVGWEILRSAVPGDERRRQFQVWRVTPGVGTSEGIKLSSADGGTGSGLRPVAILPSEAGKSLAIVETQKALLGVVRVDPEGNYGEIVSSQIPGAEVAVNRVISTADGGYLLIGSRLLKPFALRINRHGKFLWSTDPSGAASGDLRDALLLADGSILLAGLVSGEESILAGDVRVWLGEVDSVGRVVKQHEFAGRHVAIAGSASRPLLLVGGAERRGWKLLSLGDDLEVRAKTDIDAELTPLLYLSSSRLGADGLVVADVDAQDLRLRLTVLDREGRIWRVDENCRRPVLGATEAEALNDGEVILVVPTMPQRAPGNALSQGLRIETFKVPN